MVRGRVYGSSNRLLKLRQFTKGNSTGDNFGITVPRPIAEHFLETRFYCYASGNCIIFESGASPGVR